jgi:hypothetical protein
MAFSSDSIPSLRWSVVGLTGELPQTGVPAPDFI